MWTDDRRLRPPRIPSPRDLLALPGRMINLQRRTLAFTIRAAAQAAGKVTGVPLAGYGALAALLARIEPAPRGSHEFLSPEWIAAAREIRERYEDRVTTAPPPLRVNQIVTGVPFGDGDLHAHVDTTGGVIDIDLGHLEGAEVTVTLPYDVARALLVDGDPQAAVQALVAGRIKIEGDPASLFALPSASVDAVAFEVAARIRAITR